MRRLAVFALLLALFGCTSDPEPPQPSPSASEACKPFGSTEDIASSEPTALSTLVGAEMRVGKHECFERFVFEMTGTGEQPGWRAGFRDPVTEQGSGEPVELAGDAALDISLGVWTVTDFEGRPAEQPPFSGPDDIVTEDFVAIQEARNLYAFEGVTQLAIGLDQERPFRVLWLDGPPRLVVDVAL